VLFLNQIWFDVSDLFLFAIVLKGSLSTSTTNLAMDWLHTLPRDSVYRARDCQCRVLKHRSYEKSKKRLKRPSNED